MSVCVCVCVCVCARTHTRARAYVYVNVYLYLACMVVCKTTCFILMVPEEGTGPDATGVADGFELPFGY